ncbi:Crp/Fnr family transcriptional regulator [Maribacter dokdonensis]|uniref:Crp/Fnr family transcriptional regulator n=1 Tax=Maribacter dokdonensis TaxID=320912 RepID=UPI00071999E6|nr:Crp/Fnr family transcriptional regulator [Maribacter dokdonensis]KSA12282.1 transcriptional regulator, Crp/Fnr family [Maribacter dokdonensis DSW-8]
MKAITKYWFLEGFSLFKKLGMPSMMKLCNLLEMEHVDKGNIIDMGERDKNCIFFLKNGSVKIIDSENNIVKYVVKKGNIFGELSIYDKDNSSKEVAIALEDVVICYIESDMMEGLMEEYKSLKNGLLKIYGLRIRKLETRLQDLLYKDSKTRISEFIKVFIEEFGEVEKDRIVAKNLLSHKDIANLTNTSRQTVNNVLSIMRKENIIDYDSKFISYSKKTI